MKITKSVPYPDSLQAPVTFTITGETNKDRKLIKAAIDWLLENSTQRPEPAITSFGANQS
jgi:hypothetical protein